MVNRQAQPDHRHSSLDDPRAASIWKALESVTDPELPVLTVLDMGIIAAVRIDNDRVEIDVTPTFSGCPALAVIRDEIKNALQRAGETDITVNVVYDPPWTTDRLSEAGRQKLKQLGLAPPGKTCASTELPALEQTPCPYCDSTNTELESLFGPTLCRSIHYCHACRQSFEHFKTV
jgi:ring-1,2-phenylacetyl-CoA epoxidase subunit PaaD